MQEKPDAQLLRAYAEDRDQDAFRELVRRYANLVYSAAWRQTGSGDAAQDLAQEVFTDLARKAGTLRCAPGRDGENWSLAGWLYRGTRLAALEHLRKEHRRETRERLVMATSEFAAGDEAQWECIQPLLDDAMGELEEDDREALLLRFFKERDFRSIGAALGVSDDAAQKRVTRALEKIRAILIRRGVTTSAMALTTTLSANAVMMAPAGLPTLLASTALAGAAANLVVTATAAKTAAATTLQKLLAGGVMAVLAGAGVFEGTRAVKLHAEAIELNRQNAMTRADIVRLQSEREQAVARAALLAGQITSSRSNSGELLVLRRELTGLQQQSAAVLYANRHLAGVAADLDKTPDQIRAEGADRLKQWIKDHPGEAIPEFKYLTEKEWADTALDADGSDGKYQFCAQRLRSEAEHTFTLRLFSACNKYVRQKDGELPFDLSELGPLLQDPADGKILLRYAALPTAALDGKSPVIGGKWYITALDWHGDRNGGTYGVFAVKGKEVKTPGVDSNAPAQVDLASGRTNPGRSLPRPSPSAGAASGGGTLSADGRLLAKIYQAYSEANNGQMPHQPVDLQPYLTTPEKRAAYDKLMPKQP